MNEFDKKIVFLTELESTNNYANQLILSNAAEEGTVVLAQYQITGKGQRGNSWESEKGKNLLASIVVYPNFLFVGKQFLLSKVVGLALAEFLKNRIDGVSIKWPNDIYVGDKKIAGILIENSVKGNFLDSSVLGIGLNLNQELFLSDAPNPVSLKQLTGKDYGIEEVLQDIRRGIFDWYEKLKSGNYSEIDLAYFNLLFRKKKWSGFKKEGVEFEAKIIGIGEFGQLQLENRKGDKSEYMFKEIEFVL